MRQKTLFLLLAVLFCLAESKDLGNIKDRFNGRTNSPRPALPQPNPSIVHVNQTEVENTSTKVVTSTQPPASSSHVTPSAPESIQGNNAAASNTLHLVPPADESNAMPTDPSTEGIARLSPENSFKETPLNTSNKENAAQTRTVSDKTDQKSPSTVANITGVPGQTGKMPPGSSANSESAASDSVKPSPTPTRPIDERDVKVPDSAASTTAVSGTTENTGWIDTDIDFLPKWPFRNSEPTIFTTVKPSPHVAKPAIGKSRDDTVDGDEDEDKAPKSISTTVFTTPSKEHFAPANGVQTTGNFKAKKNQSADTHLNGQCRDNYAAAKTFCFRFEIEDCVSTFQLNNEHIRVHKHTLLQMLKKDGHTGKFVNYHFGSSWYIIDIDAKNGFGTGSKTMNVNSLPFLCSIPMIPLSVITTPPTVPTTTEIANVTENPIVDVYCKNQCPEGYTVGETFCFRFVKEDTISVEMNEIDVGNNNQTFKRMLRNGGHTVLDVNYYHSKTWEQINVDLNVRTPKWPKNDDLPKLHAIHKYCEHAKCDLNQIRNKPAVSQGPDAMLNACSNTKGALQCKDSNTKLYTILHPDKCTIKDSHCEYVDCNRFDLPPGDNDTCPDDSYRPADYIPKGGCCPVKQACRCRTTSCPDPKCQPGYKMLHVKQGDGLPGRCCEEWKCVEKVPVKSCLRGKVNFDLKYESHYNCQINECMNAYKKDEKDVYDFKNVSTLEDSLCTASKDECKVKDTPYNTYCMGCEDQLNGKRKIGELWQENKCKTCVCTPTGKVECKLYSCQSPKVACTTFTGTCCCDPVTTAPPSMPTTVEIGKVTENKFADVYCKRQCPDDYTVGDTFCFRLNDPGDNQRKKCNSFTPMTWDVMQYNYDTLKLMLRSSGYTVLNVNFRTNQSALLQQKSSPLSIATYPNISWISYNLTSDAQFNIFNDTLPSLCIVPKYCEEATCNLTKFSGALQGNSITEEKFCLKQKGNVKCRNPEQSPFPNLLDCTMKGSHCAGVNCTALSLPGDYDICPDDSYRPAEYIPKGGCCPVKQACRCRTSKCPERKCPKNQRLLHHKMGDGLLPGRCCDEWECVKNEDFPPACEDSEHLFFPAGTLSKFMCILHNCTVVPGRNNVPTGKPVQIGRKDTSDCSIDSKDCGWKDDKYMKNDCLGCVDYNAKYSIGAVWQKFESKCETCVCTPTGKVDCELYSCQSPKVPCTTFKGSCCCDPPSTTIAQPTTTPTTTTTIPTTLKLTSTPKPTTKITTTTVATTTSTQTTPTTTKSTTKTPNTTTKAQTKIPPVVVVKNTEEAETTQTTEGVVDRVTAAAVKDEKESDSGILILVLILVALALVVLLGAFIIWYRKRKQKKNKNKNKKTDKKQKKHKKKREDVETEQKVKKSETKNSDEKDKKKKKPAKVVKIRQMEAAPINKEEFKFKGPLKLSSGTHGSMRHAMDGKSDHSLKNPVEFDAELNEVVQIGTDIEVVEPSVSVSSKNGTEKTGEKTKSDKESKAKEVAE